MTFSIRFVRRDGLPNFFSLRRCPLLPFVPDSALMNAYIGAIPLNGQVVKILGAELDLSQPVLFHR
jgi:hypothetical protein